MSEINVLTVDCDCTDGCDCNLEELHLSCNWNRMEIFTELPATGDSGTMYYIGNNADGSSASVHAHGRTFAQDADDLSADD